jgi:hypothetical protein
MWTGTVESILWLTTNWTLIVRFLAVTDFWDHPVSSAMDEEPAKSWSRPATSVYSNKENKKHSVAWVRERTKPTERLRLSAKLVPTFADRGCRVVSVTDPYGRILGFLDRSRYFLFPVAPQLYSRGWVDPAPDPLHLRKSGSAGNRTRTSGSVARNSDH